MRLIDGDALYAKLQEHEELARKRVWDTESTLSFPTNLNPTYTRYLAQLDERITLKHMVADAPTIEQPEIIRCRECKNWIDNDGFNHEHGAQCKVMNMWMQPGDYCSYAKRREVSE